MTNEQYNEPLLLDRLIGGDAEAFRLVYEQYQGRLFAFACYLTKSKDMAEEIVQEVFIKLWEKREQIDSEKNFGQYIRRITHNHVLNYYRKTSREKKLFETFYHNIVLSRDQSSAEPLLEKELNKAYTEAISQLTPHQRQVYLLRRDEELSYQEIAQRLGISPNTVRNQLVEANRSIREYIHKNPGLRLLALVLYSASYLQR